MSKIAAPMMAAATTPQSFFDEYHIHWDETLGAGTTGTVYPCLQLCSGKAFAVKIMASTDATLREADLHRRAAERFAFVVPVIAIFHELAAIPPGTHAAQYTFLVMEMMECSLLRLVMSRTPVTLLESEVKSVLKQMASMLFHLQTELNITHRDIKLENIFVEPETFTLKLGDFGFATDSQPLTPRFTRAYVAPEILVCHREMQLGNSRPYTFACDMWSLGVVAFTALTGRFPFFGSRRIVHSRDMPADALDSTGLSKEQQSLVMNGSVAFDAPVWYGLSPDVRRIVSGLLTVDVAYRITATQLLNDPFLASVALPDPHGHAASHASIVRTLSRMASSCEDLLLVEEEAIAQSALRHSAPASRATSDSTACASGSMASAVGEDASSGGGGHCGADANGASAATTPITATPSAPPAAAACDANPSPTLPRCHSHERKPECIKLCATEWPVMGHAVSTTGKRGAVERSPRMPRGDERPRSAHGSAHGKDGRRRPQYHRRERPRAGHAHAHVVHAAIPG